MRSGQGRAFGELVDVTAVDRFAGRAVSLKWAAGGSQAAATLGADGAFVDDAYARKHRLVLGSPLRVKTPRGETLDLRLKGIFSPPHGGSPYGQVTISIPVFDRHYDNPKNLFTFIKMRGGVGDANASGLRRALRSYPEAKLETQAEFKKTQERGVNQLLNVIFVLLSLSILVSLFGIVNTMVLTVFERTREIGMLRAVGMTRRQVKRMIRQEAIVTALIGAALGIPIGVGLAAVVGRAIPGTGFTVPVNDLVGFAVVAGLVGTTAAIFPARRASRLNVLEALHYE